MNGWESPIILFIRRNKNGFVMKKLRSVKTNLIVKNAAFKENLNLRMAFVQNVTRRRPDKYLAHPVSNCLLMFLRCQ